MQENGNIIRLICSDQDCKGIVQWQVLCCVSQTRSRPATLTTYNSSYLLYLCQKSAVGAVGLAKDMLRSGNQ